MRSLLSKLPVAATDRRTISSSIVPRSVFFAVLLSCSWPAGAQVEFGDDASRWAHDGQCDDPRFSGSGLAATALDGDRLHDATDCRTLWYQGRISLRNTVDDPMGSRIERGWLEQGDRQSASGGFADDYRFHGHRGGHVLLDLRSTDFVPELLVRTPSGQELAGNGAGAKQRSLFALELGEDGLYEITVTTHVAGDAGSYVIAIALRGDTPSLQPLDRQGTLAPGDAVLQSGELVDTYEIEGWPRQRVSITLESDAFDTYLILKDPSGRQVENDDAQGVSATGASRIDSELDDLGIYEVLVTSYTPGETGPYRLVIQPSTAPRTDAAARGEPDTLDIGTPRQPAVDRGSIETLDIVFAR